MNSFILQGSQRPEELKTVSGSIMGKVLGYGLNGLGSILGEGGIVIFLHSFLSRPVNSSGKALDYGLNSPGSLLGVGGVESFLHSFVSRLTLGSTQPPIKMSMGKFPRG